MNVGSVVSSWKTHQKSGVVMVVVAVVVVDFGISVGDCWIDSTIVVGMNCKSDC